MAVAAGDRIRVYELMAGETGPLDFPFPLMAAGDVAVWRRRTGASDALLSLATHYTVTVAGDHASATVTLLAAALAGDLVALVGDITEARSTSFTGFGAGALKSGPLNSELDRLTIMVQELRRDADRSLRLSPFDANETVTLPADTDAGTIINDLLGAAAGATAAAAAASASAAAAAASQASAAASASSASSSASGAAASATSASTSETNAAASATAAQSAQALTEASAAGGSANLYRQWPSEAFPALSPWAFTSALAGVPTSGSALSVGAAVSGAWRITNSQQNVAMRDWTRVNAGRPLLIAALVERIADSASGISLGVLSMDAAGTEISRTFTTYTVAVADGRKVLSFLISDSVSGDGVSKAWAAGAVYIRPYVAVLGTSHTTDVISIAPPVPAPGVPVARSVVDSGLTEDWTVDTPWLQGERRTRLKAGGPVIYRPASNLIYLTIQYGDSTANSHSSGVNDRLPRHMTADVFPYALMLDCPYAPGVDVASATISATAFANYCDRANVGTSMAAMGQPEGIGTAYRRVLQKRERRQAQELRGYAPLGIGGARLEHIKKGGTLMSGVQMWTRLTNAVQKWIDIAAQYGMTVNVEAVHVSIGSNDTAAAYTGGLAAYKADLQTLFSDLQTDLKALTGQAANPIIAFGTTASTTEALVPSIALAQLADTYRGSTEIMPLGPEYAFAKASSNHDDLDATVLCGERLAHRMIFGLAAAGNRPKVLYPSAVNWVGDTCVLTIADATTLVIDTDSVPAHAKYGFDCATLAINSVALTSATQITVTFASTPPSGTVLTHAQGPHTDANLLPTVTGMSRGWGNIRNTRHATFNSRAKLIPSWDRANATLPGRVLNGRDCYFDDWLYNFEVTKP